MLKKLILENWKSFRYAELPLDSLTVLIGTNASGKSNVVEALEFLHRIVRGETIKVAIGGDTKLSTIRGGVDWVAFKPETQFALKALVQTTDSKIDLLYEIKVQTKPDIKILQESVELIDYNDSSEKDVIFLYEKDAKQSYLSEPMIKLNKIDNDIDEEIENWKDSQKKIKSLQANIETLIDNINIEDLKDINIEDFKAQLHERIKTLEKVNEFTNNSFTSHNNSLDKIKLESNSLKNQIGQIDNIISTLSNIFTFNPIPSKMRDYSPLSDNLESDASNIAGVLAALNDQEKSEVETTLSRYIKDFPEGDIKKVFAEPVAPLKTDAMLYCEEEWKPGKTTLINAKTMSDGTLRFIAIITALLTRPEGSQIVIEEIDNGLHPSRAELLVRILREIGSKRKIDILLTTHNPALLDALGAEIVPFVVVAHRDSETGESKLTLLEDIDNFSKLFASYSLGDMTTKGVIERSLSRNE